MSAFRAFWRTDGGILCELDMLLAVVSWDELMTEKSLASRDNTGVDCNEAGEDEILVSVNNSLMCSGSLAIVLMSSRPLDEMSFAS